jgi:hypothetical protein
MKTFKEGETSFEQKPRSGRPSTVIIDTNRQRVDDVANASLAMETMLSSTLE